MNNRYLLLGLVAACAALIVENVDARTRRGGNKNAVEPFIIYNKTPLRVSVVFQDNNGDDSLPHYIDNNATRTFEKQLENAQAIGVSFVMANQTETDTQYIGYSSQLKGVVVQDNGSKSGEEILQEEVGEVPTMLLTPLMR